MSVDQRLRSGLRTAAGPEPDTPAALSRVEQRARRESRRARWLSAAAVAAATVAAVAVGPTFIDRFQDDRQPAVRDDSPLAGTYVVDVADSPELRRLQLAGRWVVTFRPGGELVLDPPAGYDGSTAGTRYEIVDGELRTDALIDLPGCQATADSVTGTYRWEELDDAVVFTVVQDGCAAREELFTGQAWRRQ